MTSILLIGNSKNVLKTKFNEDFDFGEFKYICRFNHNWAHIYEQSKIYTGDSFNALITSNFAHDKSVEELQDTGLLSKVSTIFLICPNIQHRFMINKIDKEYFEITDEEYEQIRVILQTYNFPIDRYIPRTGITSIIYFSFIKEYKVFVHGIDVDGTDNPNDQHLKKNHKMDTKNHSIRYESQLLKRLLTEEKIFKLKV